MQYNGYRDLKVYQLSYKLCMEIFEITKSFPKEEKYSLVDQIRRSSRSIPANIAEAWKKRNLLLTFLTRPEIERVNAMLGLATPKLVTPKFNHDVERLAA